MEIIDLTQHWQPGMVTYSGDPPFTKQDFATIANDGYQLTKYTLHSHLGTHLDAPAHIFPTGQTLADYPLSRFHGRAYVVDFPTAKAEKQWLERHESALVQAEIILFRSDWQVATGQPYPLLPEAVVTWLSQRPYKCIGVDTPSVDGPTAVLPNHQHLLGNDILIVENLTNLAALPTWCHFQALPLPFPAADGSPVRAVALIEAQGVE